MQEREEILLNESGGRWVVYYLSDLHLGGYFSEQAAEAVSRIPAEEFPANEWREAFCYLTEKKRTAGRPGHCAGSF